METQITAHEQITISVGFEQHPGHKPEPIDLFEAYSVASTLCQANPHSWLMDWGHWLSCKPGWPQLTETEINSLWEQVAALRNKIINDCHERATFAAKAMKLPRPISEWMAPSNS